MASVFESTRASIYTTYDVEIQFLDKLLGGTPRDPRLIEGWIRKQAGVEDPQELKKMMVRTLEEMGVEIGPNLSDEDILKAAEGVAGERHTNGFKRDENGLYIESRQIKAMLKEATNVLYAKEKWGKTGKSPQGFVAERVFVNPDRIYLGVQEPTDVEMVIGHLSGPKGSYSTMTHYEAVHKAKISFEVKVLQDLIDAAQWAAIWVQSEMGGMGAARSQGYGLFEVTKWQKQSPSRANGKPTETPVLADTA